jgi:hypothetical protein
MLLAKLGLEYNRDREGVAVGVVVAAAPAGITTSRLTTSGFARVVAALVWPTLLARA